MKRDTQFPVQRLVIIIDNDKMMSKAAITKITSEFPKYCIVICKAACNVARMGLRESIPELWPYRS
jgi:hypothetical protein